MTSVLPSQEKQSIVFQIAAYMTILGAFSLPLLGNAAHNILLGLPVILFLFTRKIREFPSLLKKNQTALLSVLIFGLMIVSLMWSTADEALKFLSKYRDFLFIPIFMLIFSIDKYRQYTFFSLYIALTISLFCSYLIHYDLVDITTNQNSIKNRIFHGISLSFYAYMSLQAAFYFRKYKYLFITFFLVTLHNLFFVENGRTGYILILSLTGLFIWQRFAWKGVLPLILASVIFVGLATFFLETDHIRILGNTELLAQGDIFNIATLQQLDIRVEFYLLSAMAFVDNWLIGCGIGCFSDAYQIQFESNQTYWWGTVNAHNEFLQIGIQTGVFGFLFFCAFLLSILIKKKGHTLVQQQFGVALFLLVSISCIFNSSFMDHGDGMYFMLLIALICGKEWKPN